MMKILMWFVLLSAVNSCKKQEGNTSANYRSYRMGFQNSAPRFDLASFTQSLAIWSQRADAAIINTEPPWDSLYAGESAEQYVINNYKGLNDYYKSKNFKRWVYVEPGNGLDRTSDALALVALAKSIAQPDVQLAYRRFCFVMDSILQPDHIGLALETNLIRSMSPDSIYQGIKLAANAAAKDIRDSDSKVKLSVSVQVDAAWGKSGNGVYQGVDKDFADFPFATELGLSSYPYFSFTNPSDIPVNYYSRLIAGRSIPVFVTEGGWTTRPLNASGVFINGNVQLQQDYINRQQQLLDEAKAIAVFQLSFTDIDLSKLPAGVPSTIQYFAYLGLMDSAFQAKPSLAVWDITFKRPIKTGN